jgi:CheY-like chemotaxis protein
METDIIHFIVIDDSKLDCFIAEKVIKNSRASLNVKSFLSAADALEFISKYQNPDTSRKIYLLVDIQMPVMNGFEFLEAFEKLPAEVQSNYIVYILSSSINENDISKARRHPSVVEFMNKPITFASIAILLETFA